MERSFEFFVQQKIQNISKSFAEIPQSCDLISKYTICASQ